MIRFGCPHCGREYVLADAMARLPLLCKGCGQRLDVPDPTPEPPAAPVAEPVAKPQAAPPNGLLTSETLTKLDAPAEVTGPPHGQAWGAPVAKPQAAPEPPKSRNAIAFVVDVAVGLLLVGVGVLIGEFAARKSTREIIDGASGPRFPSVDLLVWLGGPVLLVLIYVLLGTRGRTLGGWLKRSGKASRGT